MADKEARKKLADAYKERSKTQTGGVYIIKNSKTGRLFIDCAVDIAAFSNRFSFSKEMGSCPIGVNSELNKDWNTFGAAAFEYDIAETMDKNEEQSSAEFRDDLEVLKRMWIDKFDPAMLY
jgi:hypothetical protein